jgi:hypothetical protein
MLRKWTCLGLLTALLVAGSACDDGSDSGGVVSCDFNGSGMHFLCEEFPASFRQDLQQACQQIASQNGTTVNIAFVDGPCSRVDALGGCNMKASGVEATVWYYETDSPGTPADIQSVCKTAGATYVSP